MQNQFNPNSLENQFDSSQSVSEIGFPWRIFLFSIFIFGFSIFVYLGLKVGYGTYLDARSNGISKDIENLAKKISESEQANLATFYSQLVNLEKVINDHRFSSNIFYFLEQKTTSGVYYESTDFRLNDMSLGLSGRGKSLNDVIGQLSVFDGAAEVGAVTLDSLGFEGSDVVFRMSLKFKENFFDKLQQ